MTLENFFPYQLAVSAEKFSRSLVEVYGAQFGLSREEWRLLYLLGEAKEIDSLALSRATTLDKVQVSRAAQRLQEKGLIIRKVASKDRRLRLYRITEKGEALYEEAVPRVLGRADAILSKMSAKEISALMTGLAALNRAVDAESSALDDDKGEAAE